MSATHTLEQLRSGALLGTRRLNLSCGLSAFPREIFELADTLEILDLSGNRLSELPDDLPRLRHLRIVFCSDNDFTVLPPVLGACPRLTMIGFKANRIENVPASSLPPTLRWLTLTDNRIAALPDQLGHCTQLQKLMLAGNRLTRLPATLAACSRLELLRIAANRFISLPGWLWTMPRLAWLAYAGNPLCDTLEAAALTDTQTGALDWDTLRLHEQLGQGASGVIYRAEQTGDPDAGAVAVKLFKGDMTSDGLPRSEMAACVAAGRHPHLIPILATLRGHPNGASGLMMPLVDAALANLAGPPSLESCTRDRYAPGTTFTLETLLAIAGAIASAARHLHRRGIVHGDLYAHNILHDGEHALLGDFGAASLFDACAPHAAALQRIEARAFGILLGELIERCAPMAQSQARTTLARLGALKHACLDETSARRPLFDEIARSLARLKVSDPSG